MRGGAGFEAPRGGAAVSGPASAIGVPVGAAEGATTPPPDASKEHVDVELGCDPPSVDVGLPMLSVLVSPIAEGPAAASGAGPFFG